MAERPLVSVVTGTWQRHTLIANIIEEVRRQTYRPIEHVIVSDGPDPDLRRLVGQTHYDQRDAGEQYVRLTFAECGRHWSGEIAFSTSAAPFLVAQLLARGDLQMWLSDDETMAPDHVEALVDLLEATNSDFAYSRADWWVPGRPHLNRTIGTVPPAPDQLTNALYRRELLDYGTFRLGVGRGTDWDQVSRWLDAGASYAMLDRVTFSHRADQVGGVESNQTRQPLRGWSTRQKPG